MKRTLGTKVVSILILISWLTSFVLTPVTGVLAHNTLDNTPSNLLTNPTKPALAQLPDPDFDGIPTTLEQSGWTNGVGGPFKTDPNNPDSDGDGLTDGKEQLYDTNPLDDRSPGIYVEYRDEYQSKKFYPWIQHGSDFIVTSQAGNSKDQDVITRRGTSLIVGGPSGANLTIQKSKSSLDNLNPIQNTCGGGWVVPIPANNTVGTYTLIMKEGGWSNSLTLHVILERDTPQGELTQNHIDILGYNDDLKNQKDLLTVYWDTSYEYLQKRESDKWTLTEHEVYGWGIGWETDYNQRYVFEDHVMRAIQGATTREGVTRELAQYIDSEGPNGAGMEFNAFSFPNSTKNALSNLTNFDQDGDGLIDADCNGNAGVFTTFLKAAGLTSRPIAVDWKHKHYDTSTEIWLDGQWQVIRAYSYNGGDNASGLRSRSHWGNKVYKENNDLILVVEPNFALNQININYAGKEDEDYYTGRYESQGIYPHGSGSSINKWGWVGTPTDAYWGSKQPTVTGDCSGNNCKGGSVGDFSADEPSLLVTHPEQAQFGNILSDYGVDLDNDGQFDQLIVEVEVNVNQAGNYTIQGILNDTDPETQLGGQIDAIAGSEDYVYLEAGTHIWPLKFRGTVISGKQAQGPYVLEELQITTLENPYPGQVEDDTRVDLRYPNHLLDYELTEFDHQWADLPETYSHQAQDTNGDGYVDRVIIKGTLDIHDPGTYSVSGDLVDINGKIVASAGWTGTDGQVALQFDGMFSSTSSYYLRNVDLSNGNGDGIESQGSGTTSYNFDNFAYATGSLYDNGLQSLSASTLGVASATPVDTDKDGDFDRLDFVVNASIVSAVPTTYNLEAWLQNSTGSLIALRSSQKSLTGPGTFPFTLSYDGQSINAMRANGPFKLVALKLSTPSGIVNEVNVAYETQNFVFNQFDGPAANFLLEDRFEGTNHSANWNLAATDWSITNEAFKSPTQSWTDSPGNNYAPNSVKTLTSKPVPVPNVGGSSLPVISFESCYAFGNGDVGKVQVRVNGQGGWQDVSTYSGGTNGWETQYAAPYQAVGASSMEFRFQVIADGNGQDDGWHIDDLIITTSNDVDEDGLPNDVEGGTSGRDTDKDGIPDLQDPDSDNDGIPDAIEKNIDSDGDNIPDYMDTDADNDGLSDQLEGNVDTDGDGRANYRDPDSDNDGILDATEGNVDSDNDGIPDYLDIDSDGDGALDVHEGNIDPDKDGKPSYLDPDSDNDGIPDGNESPNINNNMVTPNCTNPGGLDTDKDGIANCLDPDIDGDGITNVNDLDSDGDGINDATEYGPKNKPKDTDNDGIPDFLDSTNNAFSNDPILRFIRLPLILK